MLDDFRARQPARVQDDQPILSVRDLCIDFETRRVTVHAVRGVSFSLRQGDTLVLVGESGSGKSSTARALLQLIRRPGRVIRGQVLFRGTDLLTLPEREMRKIRGKRISIIPQDSMSALNPLYPVGPQLGECFQLHEGMRRKDALAKAIDLMGQVGIPAPEQRAFQFPYELSGGMRQRIVIAMAFGLAPDIVIADEPTSALDVTIQAQILTLLKDLQRDRGMSMLLVTHDLGVAARYGDMIAVMLEGAVVEYNSVRSIYSAPKHPYTQRLLSARSGGTR